MTDSLRKRVGIIKKRARKVSTNRWGGMVVPPVTRLYVQKISRNLEVSEEQATEILGFQKKESAKETSRTPPDPTMENPIQDCTIPLSPVSVDGEDPSESQASEGVLFDHSYAQIPEYTRVCDLEHTKSPVMSVLDSAVPVSGSVECAECTVASVQSASPSASVMEDAAANTTVNSSDNEVNPCASVKSPRTSVIVAAPSKPVDMPSDTSLSNSAANPGQKANESSTRLVETPPALLSPETRQLEQEQQLTNDKVPPERVTTAMSQLQTLQVLASQRGIYHSIRLPPPYSASRSAPPLSSADLGTFGHPKHSSESSTIGGRTKPSEPSGGAQFNEDPEANLSRSSHQLLSNITVPTTILAADRTNNLDSDSSVNPTSSGTQPNLTNATYPKIHALDPNPSFSQLPPVGCITKFPNASLNVTNALICHLCGFPRTCVEELEAHIAWDHWNWAPYGCAYCPSIVRPTQYTMRLHLAEAHADQPQKVICAIDDTKAKMLRQEVHNAVQRLFYSRGQVPPTQVGLGYGIIPQNPQNANRNRDHSRSTPGGITNGIGLTQYNTTDGGRIQPISSLSCQLPLIPAAAVSTTNSMISSVNDQISGGQQSAASQPQPFAQLPLITATAAATNSIVSSATAMPISYGQMTNNMPSSQANNNNKATPVVPPKIHILKPGMRLSVKELACQLCSNVVKSKAASVHDHIYDHLHKNGLGFRFQCGYCGSGAIRKVDLLAHFKSAHNLATYGSMKHRTNELRAEFNQVKDQCFPLYTAVSFDLTKCNECNEHVPTTQRAKHIYSHHMKQKTVKCGYCDHAIYVGGSLNRHLKMKHPGKPVKVEYLTYLYKKEFDSWREKCFSRDRRSTMAAVETDANQSKRATEANTTMPTSARKSYGSVVAQLIDSVVSQTAGTEKSMVNGPAGINSVFISSISTAPVTSANRNTLAKGPVSSVFGGRKAHLLQKYKGQTTVKLPSTFPNRQGSGSVEVVTLND